MKATFYSKIFFLCSIGFIAFTATAQNGSWLQKTSIPSDGRATCVGFAIGGKGYVGLGLNFFVAGGSLEDFWEYDPGNDSWTQKADYGGGKRGGATAFVIGDKGYVMTGTDQNAVKQKDLWEFDPVANTWTQKADLSQARNYATAFSAGTKGYLATGEGTTGPLNDLWEYDPVTDTWTQRADVPGVGRSSAISFSIDGVGYLGTGYTAGPKKDFYAYDTLNNTWTQKADVGITNRSQSAAFVIDGFGYVCSGQKAAGFSHDLLRYDPLADTWTLVEPLPGSGKSNAAGFGIDKGYIAGGFDLFFSQTKDLYEYSPDSSVATMIEELNSSYSVHVIPNLISDQAIITIRSSEDLKIDAIEMYYSGGSPVSPDHFFTEFRNQNEIVLHLRRESLSEGIYVLVLKNAGRKVSSHKLLLQ